MTSPLSHIQNTTKFARLCLGLLAFVMALGGVACSEKDERELSDYDQANEHIENGNFQSAIHLMDDRLKQRPSDQKARVILASAYAARGGVYLRNYIDLASELLASKDSKSEYGERQNAVFDRLRSNAKEGEKDLIDTLAEFNKALWQVSDVIVKFDKIPSVAGEAQYEDVKSALNALSGIENLDGGPAVYSGLLRLVLFRYHLTNYYRFPEVKNCLVDISDLYKKVNELRVETSLIFKDFQVGIANEKNSKKMEALAETIDKSFKKALEKLIKYSEEDSADLSLFLIPFGVECE